MRFSDFARPRCVGASALFALILGAVTVAPIAQAQQGAADPAEAASVADWANRVWSTAKTGDDQAAFDLLGELPRDHDVAAVQKLREALDQRNEHLEEARAEREQRLEEAWSEFRELIDDEADVAETLRAAVEVHSLARDKKAVLNDPAIERLTGRAEEKAKQAEKKGRWLDAQELFYRLNLLHEDSGRYQRDLDRTGARLMMIRLYAPERFHDMRDEMRQREGEDALPPFNELGEDWREKLKGVRSSMIVRALGHAQRSYVDDAEMSEMLIGGLKALRTLVTTDDLASVFDGLKDEGKVDAFIEWLEEQIASLENRGDKADYLDLTRTVRRVGRVNERTVDLPEEVIVHEFGDGALRRLDEFSGVIWPDELDRFRRTTEGSFTGVGIQITLDEAHRLKVVTPLAGTPAHRAGILPGDLITAVDGESTVGITLNGAVERITGPAGEKVTLTVEREGAKEPIEYELTRARIPIHTVKGWRRNGPDEMDWDWFIDRENKIGYVWITQFADNTTQEFDRAIREMKKRGLNGLILDLRFNPGGLLSQAVGVANRFIDDGTVVTQHDASGAVQDRQTTRSGLATLEDVPVTVLVNGGSASASEIVAGALQDHGRAVVVGTRTFGKGSVQNVYNIGRGVAALRLTTQYYRLPEGRLIHRRPGDETWGVKPDVTVEMSPERIGEAITLRQQADVLPVNDEGEVVAGEQEERTDPDRLIDEGVDTQLESALVLVQSQSLAKSFGFAMLEEKEAAGS